MGRDGGAREGPGLRVRAGAAVGGAVLTAWLGTTKSELIAGGAVESEFLRGGKPAIYVLWHGRLLPCAFTYRRHRLVTLISRNRDGDFIAPMVRRWGYEVVRGSSSRGGSAAMREIVRQLEAGRSVALTPDGPRGPRQKMKLGPLRAAMKAGVPVIPVSGGATRGAFFGGWDRFLVPAPFALCPIAFGDPMWIATGAGEKEVETTARAIEATLNRLTEQVDRTARERRG